jgi:hypothetical protein
MHSQAEHCIASIMDIKIIKTITDITVSNATLGNTYITFLKAIKVITDIAVIRSRWTSQSTSPQPTVHITDITEIAINDGLFHTV